MTPNDYQKIRQLFDDYLRMYASRDDRLTEYFSEDFSGITGSGDLLTKDREEWIAITRQDFAQVKDPLRIELKDLIIQSLSDAIAVATSSFTIHLPIKDHILSRKTARLVLIFRSESAGWKICHSSISIPFAMAQEGEIYPLQDLEERNQFLEELIAERTLQLSEAKAAAEAANRAKSQFLATMSHEIRTPLNALVGFSALARETSDPAKLDQYHAILQQSSSSLLGLVNDILDMSKIEAGRMVFETVPLNLRQLVASLEEQYTPLANRKMLDFSAVVADNVPAWVLGDPMRLRQILVNLLSNAVKFTESGKVTCTVSLVGQSVKKDQTPVRFEVCDTGIGIPEASHVLLFQPFRQLDATISRKFGGSGLGLAIVNSLVETMHGNITVESREGVGSCFIVELPLVEIEPPADEPRATPVALAPRAVLVVEDNTYNRRLLGDILTSWGQRVTLAKDGWQALLMMEQQHFDLILLDIRMPDIDGMEVARRVRLREHKRSVASVPIIAITADTDAVTCQACLGAGINAVLTKPVIPEQLAGAIAAQCGDDREVSHGGKLLLNSQTRSDLGNNPERSRQYQEMLQTDINDELHCLREAHEADDLTELGRAAHSLKGLCAHLANREPAELAAWLQHNALSAQREEMRQVVEQLLEHFNRVQLPSENTP
ncbi:MAG: response regulator [Desulfuromonadales bacterium]|nr:response regulator [Desulfuromonadales bacterium]